MQYPIKVKTLANPNFLIYNTDIDIHISSILSNMSQNAYMKALSKVNYCVVCQVLI